jgi:hypothetical protein
LLVDEEEPFEDLVGEIADGARAPRIVASVAGTAIHEARRSAGATRR